MAVNGMDAARSLLARGTCTPGLCLYYVWQAYNAHGATASASYPTAYDAWLGSPGKHSGDRNPPPGVPVYWRPRTGSRAGDVVISLGGGRVAATDWPYNGRIGETTIDAREKQIGLPYLGWTDNILGYPIAIPTTAGGASTPLEEDDMPLSSQDLINILEAQFQVQQGTKNRTVSIKDALSAVFFYGDKLNADVASTPARVWGHPLQHSLAKGSDGNPVAVPAGDLLRYEPAEHEATRRAVAVVAGGDIDYERIASEIAEAYPTLDPYAFAVAAADEVDRRERERLG